jgi:hypothetical protein
MMLAFVGCGAMVSVGYMDVSARPRPAAPLNRGKLAAAQARACTCLPKQRNIRVADGCVESRCRILQSGLARTGSRSSSARRAHLAASARPSPHLRRPAPQPGNWSTGLAGGARYGYALLCVVLLSSLAAMFLQHLSLKLGVASGRDLAQACRDAYPRSGRRPRTARVRRARRPEPCARTARLPMTADAGLEPQDATRSST